MNEEIRKFWEATGNRISGPSIIDSYELHIGTDSIYRIETIAHGNKYRYNKIWYTEEEMLRIIRLKAFI
jgi:hypothetical protein